MTSFLPTSSLLNHQNLALNGLCPCCPSLYESFLHCIRDCTISKNLWHFLGFIYVEFFNNMDPHDYLKLGLTSLRSNIFAFGIWWSWRNRNYDYFCNFSIPIYRLVMEARNLSTILISHFHNISTTNIHDGWI
jgi:hypothetical protein